MNQRCGSCKVEKPKTDFSPSYRGKPGTWCRACFADYAGVGLVATPHAPQECAHCGSGYVPAQIKPDSAYCSRACKERARTAREATEREESKPKRSCVWCSADMPKSMRSDAKFCSPKCNRAAHLGTRKMWSRLGLKREDHPLVGRAVLAARDGLQCYLCDRPMRLATKHPDPGYASIDHVHPLSRGGGNDLANLRLAHLVCNLRKHARMTEA